MIAAGSEREPWLPDLCKAPRLLVMLSMAELIVVVLALAPDGGSRWDGSRFLSASGFALWLALTVSVGLCVSRHRLARFTPAWGAGLALAGAALVAAGAAAMTHMIDSALGYGLVPPEVSFARFVSGTATITGIAVGVVLRYLYVNDGLQAQVRASARAEVEALQARIRPHFLFNSMNTIAGLVRRDPVVAERAVLDLSDLFRAALGAGEPGSTLAEEVELAERFLAIEQLRLGERLQVAWHKAEPLPWRLPMPRLLLQPLVENAVVHGIARLPAGGTIELTLACVDDALIVQVRNPAPEPGMPSLGARHAQSSIALRLTHAYGPEARMTAGWQQGYYRCELRVPMGAGSPGATHSANGSGR